jgi:mannose-6-phosphate isomerase-like protein (cupin superfamily)
MSNYRSFALDELIGDKTRAYREFLRRPGISVGLYQIPAGGDDPQHPHDSDEVYVVIGGRAGLEVEGERLQVGEGSVVSVDRGVEHRFVDVTEDLSVLVIFAPPSSPDL